MIYPSFTELSAVDVEDLISKWKIVLTSSECQAYKTILDQLILTMTPSLDQNQLILKKLIETVTRASGISQVLNKRGLHYYYLQEIREGRMSYHPDLGNLLIKKIGKSTSGIVSITVMTSPGRFSCPHDCYYCPDDPESARSYDRNGPVAMRAAKLNFDVVRQFRDRALNLLIMGHDVTKIEMLVIGGTWSYHQKEYQREFMTGIYYAANTFHCLSNLLSLHDSQMSIRPVQSLEREIEINQTSQARIIGVTVETRPDMINLGEIRLLRSYGVTRVQLGIQHLDSMILDINNRKCNAYQIYRGIQLLKENGFKIDAHFMPDLPGSDYQTDLEMFQFLFSSENECVQADQLKIYPTMVTRFTKILEWYKNGTYQPYSERHNGQLLFDLIVYIVTHVPPWIRINRIVRDIPSTVISGQFKETNLHQRIMNHLKKENLQGTDIRTREVKLDQLLPSECQLFLNKYRSSNGTEYFLSYENRDRTKILGFIRIRINDNPDSPGLEVLKGAVLIRELHTYGKLIPQHLPNQPVVQKLSDRFLTWAKSKCGVNNNHCSRSENINIISNDNIKIDSTPIPTTQKLSNISQSTDNTKTIPPPLPTMTPIPMPTMIPIPMPTMIPIPMSTMTPIPIPAPMSTPAPSLYIEMLQLAEKKGLTKSLKLPKLQKSLQSPILDSCLSRLDESNLNLTRTGLFTYPIGVSPQQYNDWQKSNDNRRTFFSKRPQPPTLSIPSPLTPVAVADTTNEDPQLLCLSELNSPPNHKLAQIERNQTQLLPISGQHLGVGKLLLRSAEQIAKKYQTKGFDKICIIAGVGVREYYQKRGYHLEDTYMVKKMDEIGLESSSNQISNPSQFKTFLSETSNELSGKCHNLPILPTILFGCYIWLRSYLSKN
jgi:elongator complex protein 3